MLGPCGKGGGPHDRQAKGCGNRGILGRGNRCACPSVPGRIYRSTVWRTRLDTTTNWSVVTLGVALSITYSSPEASPLPLVLVGVLILLFLTLEARRYRFFNVWRARARWIERHFYVPMLMDGDLHTEQDWQVTLAKDYSHPQYHVSYMVTSVTWSRWLGACGRTTCGSC